MFGKNCILGVPEKLIKNKLLIGNKGFLGIYICRPFNEDAQYK